MDLNEQENQRLREEVTTLKGESERLTAMVITLLAAQTQPSVRLPTSTFLAQPSTSPTPISTVYDSTPQRTMVEGYLHSTPFSVGEVLNSHVFEVPLPTTQYAVLVPPPGTKFPQDTMCNAPFNYLIILLDDMVYVYILYEL